MYATWVSHAHHMGITCTSCGYYMHIIWVSYGVSQCKGMCIYLDTDKLFLVHFLGELGYKFCFVVYNLLGWDQTRSGKYHSHEHTGITCTSHGYHIHATWVSHAHHMVIKWISVSGMYIYLDTEKLFLMHCLGKLGYTWFLIVCNLLGWDQTRPVKFHSHQHMGIRCTPHRYHVGIVA